VLSGAETFAYGALGSFAALLVVHALPWGISLSQGAEVHITPVRVFGVFLIVAVFIVAGGVFAMALGDADQPKQAIAYGLGWQGSIGGLIQGVRASTD
jgi:membrane associated rhomboid family serine protease